MSERLWMLGHDGGGNGYVVLPSGHVGIWDHELGEVESHGRFANLDVFGWAIALAGAVAAGALRVDHVIGALTGEGSGGCVLLAARLSEQFGSQGTQETAPV